MITKKDISDAISEGLNKLEKNLQIKKFNELDLKYYIDELDIKDENEVSNVRRNLNIIINLPENS